MLESGEYFSVNSDTLHGIDLGGLEHGTVSDNAGAFSSANDLIYIFGQSFPISQVGFSGHYATQSFNTTMVLTGGSAPYLNVGIPLTYSATDSRTIYDNPIALTDISGANFSGFMYGKPGSGSSTKDAITTLSVNVDGTFTANAGTCSVSGTMTPHLTTAVFDLTATVSGTGCSYAGAMAGVVTPSHWATGNKNLMFQMFSSNKQSGLLFTATKP
jgi:hypothetical protein